MLFAYRLDAGRLTRMEPEADLVQAIWIDLYRPQPEQIAELALLGVVVPTLEDMEEIEISSRLYREAGVDFMTVMLPGATPEKVQISAPVTFVVTAQRLVTVRHHAPRPFETFPGRAEQSSAGCANHLRLFMGLIEDIVARQADLLEGVGRSLDKATTALFEEADARHPDNLHASLVAIGRQGEVLARVRLGLLTLERMLSVYTLWAEDTREASGMRPLIKAQIRDIQALEVHADFLSGRVGMVTDTTLGMVNLAQNATIRIVSVVAALFLPPTVIASAYGMNFAMMPELDWRWGYPMALGMMVASAVATWVYFKWKRWL